MENVSKDIFLILQYLLPGFISAWIFYGFTSFVKPSQFERIIQALIFTLFIHACIYPIKKLLLFIGKQSSIGIWNESTSLICSIIIAFIFGIVFSYFANNDKFHHFFRKRNITNETSYPSEWFGSFLEYVSYIVLHLNDERRIMGWPVDWPSEPTKGHFRLEDVSWLDGKKEIKLLNVKYILINVADVKFVEFIKIKEKKNGKKRIKSSS